MPPRTPTIISTTSTSAERHEYSFSINRGGHKWLTVAVRSRSRSAASAPAYVEGDHITGRLELDIDRPETIKEVEIAVEGVLTSVQQPELVFLSMQSILWASDGKPAKFYGKYSWSFNFILPPQVSVDSQMYKLPPNFSEKPTTTYIDYRLVANVKRGAFKPNQMISQGFVYKPVSTPPLPSAQRQLAYRNGSALASPSEDPEGWNVLPSLCTKGTIHGRNPVEVTCTLAIAAPLCYAVKSIIPLAMVLASRDEHFLRLLSHPTAARVVLFKHTITGSGGKKNNALKTAVGEATFWSSRSNRNNGVRYLEGELEIPAGLKPSFNFPRLAIQYTLEMLPFEVTGFTASSDTGRAISEPITLTTMQTPGLITRSYAPRS
ncbi:hypothetical protein L218DRAFT_941314 [Marasmius fiardii PR-910]|nr:hypothetical protein L218DRAFT_941314 [Marasmius fiardii PR-910]